MSYLIGQADAVSVQVLNGDCHEHMETMRKDGIRADLIFADPPFNIGYSYDVYNDNKSLAEYLDWSEEWIGQCVDLLKPNGSIWIAAPDEYQHRFRVILEDVVRLDFVAHICWSYSFGQHRKRGFTRSHAHLLHYVKNRKSYTWNGDAVKIPSWRQLNGDKRAAPGGRHPDDTWQFPRICGTHKERLGWHKCQMPEAVMARIIRVSSNPGDLVLDPYLGSGTTGAVAKKLGRNFVGIELSEDYAAKAKARIDGVGVNDPIQGESN